MNVNSFSIFQNIIINFIRFFFQLYTNPIHREKSPTWTVIEQESKKISHCVHCAIISIGDYNNNWPEINSRKILLLLLLRLKIKKTPDWSGFSYYYIIIFTTINEILGFQFLIFNSEHWTGGGI